jgi:hypothetical protein
VETPPRVVDVEGANSVGDVGATTPPGVIDVDHISAQPAVVEDLVKDQPQIDQALEGPGILGAQVPRTWSSSPIFPLREINWNHTSYQDDLFEYNEDMQALWTSIVTINTTLTVSCF